MERTPRQVVTEIKAELRRRKIARWAMIARKMKKEEPMTDLSIDLSWITEFCWGNREYRQECVEANILPSLILLLKSKKNKEAANSASAISAIAVENEHKQACIDAGAVPALVPLIGSLKGKESQYALSALLCISRDSYSPGNLACVQAGLIPILLKRISTLGDRKHQTDIDLLKNLAIGDYEFVDACVSAGTISTMVRMISSRASSGLNIYNYLCVLQYITAGREWCREELVREGVIPLVVSLIESSDEDSFVHIHDILVSMCDQSTPFWKSSVWPMLQKRNRFLMGRF